MKVSANLGFLWAQLPLLARVEAAHAAGFKFIEIHEAEGVSPLEMKKALDLYGLTLLSLNAGMKDGGLGALKGRETEFQASIDAAIEFCVVTGAKNIHALAGNISSIEKMAATSVFLENLRIAATKAAKHGLTILLEPLNPVDRPHYFYCTLQEASSVISRLGLSNIKIMADIYHIGVSEGDITRALTRFWPQIGHVQVASVPHRREIDDGEVNYKYIIEFLHELGLKTPIGLEYKPRAEVATGLKYMKNMGLKF